ncbi:MULTISPECIES: long-chain fatty acid--CoA ligase [unclassified Microbacterium]|uniref:acyl-CoA synthetase n=1 Tax=unclassified Microbacterium TaxID=2609290 RepID=UPI00214BF2D1|nr:MULTISPECIES: long-chain fatty acid--CoA ligase [unclassified Microbacterium]MCR2808491.1 long-chain fatty acid--CoA ligase [Microbacterium sp. zg.B185]WIM19069.1 long-chain fatty acid--CoA ligase [Microbacterium sp. zg-B185]
MHNQGLGAWMAKRRLKTPDKPALIHGEGESVSYRQLADGTDRVSALLWHRGVRKGDRVAFIGENSPEFVQVLFGTAQLGAVFVPVNTRLAPPEIAHVLTDSGARVLIHGPEFAGRVADGVATAGIPHVIVTGDGGLNDLLAATPGGHVDADVALDDPAAILYTSGTTGKAKGAVLTHQNLTSVALNCLVDYDIVSTDVALMISPLFHAASLGMGALPVILKGATMVLEKGFEAGRALELIEHHGVTMLSGVPTTFQLLADHPRWGETDLSTLQKLTCGGSAVPTRILNAYEQRGLSFSQGYGMTETSPGATSLAPDKTRSKQGSVGLPHFFTDVRIVDGNGAMVPRGTVGEIEVTGPNVFAGYLNLPAETAAAFSPDGWFRSGDMGYLDPDGYLFIADRLKDMIISGGENIYPAEIENLINDIDGVTGVAVIGVSDDAWGEVPLAVLTVRGGAAVSVHDVRAHLDGKLARYKIPKRVIVTDELPRTASGKVRKADLRARFGG